MASKINIGIGITTFNRVHLLERTLIAIKQHTTCNCVVFVADDGSNDATSAFLSEQGVEYLSAANRGIAWNKNRALYYLSNIRQCDIIILLEDDTFPIEDGWEVAWIDAALRYGHVNLAPSHWPHDHYLKGAGTVDDPFVSIMLTGQCSAFTRTALNIVGYMDTRFRRYGYEHVEHTHRMIACGYGGVRGFDSHRFLPYLINSSLTVAGLDIPPDMDGIRHNAPIYDQIKNEPSSRPPWRTDEEMAIHRAEMASVKGAFADETRNIDPGPDWRLSSFNSLPLIVDRVSQRIRAVERGSNAGNVRLRLRDRVGTLIDGSLNDSKGSRFIQLSNDGVVEWTDDLSQATQLEFVSAPGPGFGLRRNDFYLCCNPSTEFLVTLNRLRLSDWETFHFDGYQIG